jgi:hypothetical protein
MPSISSAEESLPLEERGAREQDVNSGAPHFNIKIRGLPKLPPQDVNTKEKRGSRTPVADPFHKSNSAAALSPPRGSEGRRFAPQELREGFEPHNHLKKCIFNSMVKKISVGLDRPVKLCLN